MGEPKRVLITGAAGQIGYALLPLVAAGGIFGPNQPVILHLLEITAALKALDGIVMELNDCAYPLLKGVVPTDKADVAFKDIDAVLFVGAFPRKPGMERKDLISKNASIFSEQGKILDKLAKKDVKVLVVGNPANTNCLIVKKNAPSIPKENFTCLTRLDHNRAKFQLADKAKVSSSEVKNPIIWGNHSSTQYPDYRFATIGGKPAPDVINDAAWAKEAFVKTVQQRGAAIMTARGLSSALSAAHAIVDHMRDWIQGTPEGEFVSMGVPADGSYGISEDLIFSYPVKCKNGKYEIVQGLSIDEFSQKMIETTKKELMEEAALVDAPAAAAPAPVTATPAPAPTGSGGNTCAVLKQLGKFEFERREIPKPKPHGVLIKMATVTICGSDVSYFRKGKCGIFELKGQPLILGHECSGIIESVGDGVKNVKPGDRVAIEPGIPCRYCQHCRSGHYNLCPDVVFLATPPVDGSLCNYIEHVSDFVYKMPDHMSFEEGALLEPLSVAVHACDRGGVKAGSHVLITGAGPIGLVSLLVARASGATKVFITDMLDHRLALATKLGANGVFKASDPVPEVVKKLAAEGGVTHSIECSGHDGAIALCIKATNPGGKVVSIGRGHADNQTIPLFEAADKEIDLLGSFRYHGTYAKALELVASGQVVLKNLVSHRFNFDQVQQAFETAETGKDGCIKAAINIIPQ